MPAVAELGVERGLASVAFSLLLYQVCEVSNHDGGNLTALRGMWSCRG